jgi:hypothetical protein
MPSNRNFARSLKSLENVYAFPANISVSDNSQCPNKAAAWPKNIPSEPCKMMENQYKAFQNTTGEYVLLMGDDDLIINISDVEIDVPKDVVGLMPIVQAFTPQHGVVKIHSAPIMAETASARITEFVETCGGSNLAFFSFWRRDVLGSILDLWCNYHPTKGAYADWAVSKALVSSGKVMRDTQSVFFKDISNWAGDQESINLESKRLFKNCGYERLYENQTFLQAIDSYIMINRKDSPVPEAERLEAARASLRPFSPCDILKGLEKIGMADSYREFFKHSVGRDWDL